MKKALRGTQTLRAGKTFRPAADPLPRGAGRPKLNQLTMVTTLQTKFGEDRCTQFRVIVVTDPQTNTPTNKQTHTHTQTHRQDRLQYTAPQLASAQCNDHNHNHKVCSQQ